jgi:hypothetical protein
LYLSRRSTLATRLRGKGENRHEKASAARRKMTKQ